MFWNQIPEQGCSGEIWSKFSGSLAGWCITDSLSHTTYVETNKKVDGSCSCRSGTAAWSKFLSGPGKWTKQKHFNSKSYYQTETKAIQSVWRKCSKYELVSPGASLVISENGRKKHVKSIRRKGRYFWQKTIYFNQTLNSFYKPKQRSGFQYKKRNFSSLKLVYSKLSAKKQTLNQ